MEALRIIRSREAVEEASEIRAADIIIQGWVRDSCEDCEYVGKSWSCPPGVGSIEEARKKIHNFSRAVFVMFRSSGDRKALEKEVLDIEEELRKAGYQRAMGFFTSPCSHCRECSFLEECPHPEKCRPTGEAWGIDLLATSDMAGIPVEIVSKGEEFKPVTVFLIE